MNAEEKQKVLIEKLKKHGESLFKQIDGDFGMYYAKLSPKNEDGELFGEISDKDRQAHRKFQETLKKMLLVIQELKELTN